MHVEFVRNKKIPTLAWCCTIDNSNAIVTIGSGVEQHANFWCEGAWDGDFGGGEFAKSTFFLGSGGTISEDSITFSSPSHPLERLYRISVDEKTYVSNSLPFILVASGSEIDQTYYDYESDFATILNGINKYKKILPLASNRTLHLHYMSSFECCNGKTKELERNIEAPFLNFENYQLRLLKFIDGLNRNANDPLRRISYGLNTTVSNGYDAAACAVLAQKIGCNEAVSFDKPQKYKNDNGKEITEALKYEQVIYRSAEAYLENTECIEAEYCSSGELGTGIVFSAFNDIWPRKIVFMGERGDKLWSKNWPDVNNELRVRGELYTNTSMVESRLRVGYILCPLPLFGALQWLSIAKISKSVEMNDYSVGGTYDRPIPRRLIEEAGVPRSVFGQEKNGAGFNYRFDTRGRLKKRMSETSYRHFIHFCQKNEKWDLSRFCQLLRYLWFYRAIYINKLSKNLRIPLRVRRDLQGHVSNPGAPLSLFKWGISVMTDKYRRSLDSD